MIPQRIQLSRKKGWRMPENTVKVDRSTKWGNPFKVGIDGNVNEVMEKYRKWLNAFAFVSPLEYAKIIDLLRGKNLACWCKLGEPCHADVLLEIANKEDKP